MYLEYLYVILDYHSTLNRKERMFEHWLPFIIGILSLSISLYNNDNSQYIFIKNFLPFIATLLGFALAALALLISNNNIENKTKDFMTKRKIRGKNISMFRLIVVSYSYLIILSALLCILFYIASLFPYISIGIWCVIPNTIFIIGIFNILFATIRTISMLYFILTRSK